MMQLRESGYKEANGINLYYEIYGEGKPLVLIHGGGSDLQFDYREVIQRMSGQYKLIGIDLQNHGRSEHREVPETFEQDAKDIIAVLGQLGIDKASFWGFSNGATTVLLIANLFPAKVEKIIAASGVTKRSGMMDGFFEGMAQATIDHMPQYLKDNFLKLNPDPRKLQHMFEKDSQRMIHFKDWDDSMLRAIQSPVLFIAGDNDVMKTSHIAEMHNLVHGSRLMIFPSGHGSYMMANENGNVDKALIDFTVAQVEYFLSN
ncbi:MAG: alpha/beta hydrolase [Terrimonas sp.]|nr:alpha/beta hydrolase [Terrimonas sp.]OJY98063.1 MAG: alpha/beta hydrolase [Sphingobacteriales bacterium 40-81]